jgi:hypothetical protein
MSTFSIAFDLATNCPTLGMGFELWLDGEQILDRPSVEQPEKIVIDAVPDSDQTHHHVLEFVFKNKLPSHTIVNESGEFIQDPVITIQNFEIDGIECDNVIHQIAQYHHDFNGTADATVQPFYGIMGCVGRVKVEFSTPIFVWLLEHI